MITAEVLMLLGGLAAFGVTVWTVRRRAMSEKYAVLWLGVATMLLIVGLFPRILMLFADNARLSYPSAVLFVALGGVYLFAMSVTVALSRAKRRTTRLAQEYALLAQEVRQLTRVVESADLDSRASSEVLEPELERELVRAH